MTPLISIIVPVYNSEKTLCRCVDSVINQPFNNWEILLIDDGSTDKSFEICENYALKDKRITVLHKENGGVSSARNIGLDNAKGKWVTFIDSDDYIAVDALSMDYNTLDEDLLLFPYYSINNGKESLVKIGNEQIIKDHHDLICFYNEYLLCTILRSPWSKFLKKYNWFFTIR